MAAQKIVKAQVEEGDEESSDDQENVEEVVGTGGLVEGVSKSPKRKNKKKKRDEKDSDDDAKFEEAKKA